MVNHTKMIDYISFLNDLEIYDKPESLIQKPIPDKIKEYLQ